MSPPAGISSRGTPDNEIIITFGLVKRIKNHRYMEITGTLIHMLPLQTGQGKNGTWKKQEFVIETTDAYPKKVCIAAWGDKVDTSKFVIGQNLKINFDAESREYNGRWYTDLKAFSVQIGGGAAAAPGTDNMPPAFQGPIDNEAPDDLPF